jgi:glutamate dehydrogenase (NADP+)
MLKTKGDTIKGKTIIVSGSGNVAQFAAEKATELGGKVVTMSDSGGYIYDAEGIDTEKLAYIQEIKNVNYGRISDYLNKYPSAKYVAGKRPWEVKADIALPCATQNELNKEEAEMLIANGCMCVSEGANMPCIPEAVTVFQNAKILFAPGKASNAGGVATSGLEMSQNSLRMGWTSEEVDEKLKRIMLDIHASCVQYGSDANGHVDYVKGANIAGFVKVADAMLAQGAV